MLRLRVGANPSRKHPHFARYTPSRHVLGVTATQSNSPSSLGGVGGGFDTNLFPGPGPIDSQNTARQRSRNPSASPSYSSAEIVTAPVKIEWEREHSLELA